MSYPSPRRLVGVVSAMMVWALWFVIVYGLTSVGCAARWNQRAVPGGNLLTVLLLATAIVALALIARSAWVGYCAWRTTPETRLAAGEEAGRRQAFMGLLMLVLSLLAGAATLMIALPILMLDPCAA